MEEIRNRIMNGHYDEAVIRRARELIESGASEELLENTPPPPSGEERKNEIGVPKRNLPVYKRARFCPGCKMLGEWVILGHSWYFNCKFCGYWDREEHPKS